MPKYKVGDIVKCRVTGIEKYGFFVVTCDENKCSGLVHLSEMSESFVKDVNDFVVMDEEIFAKVIGMVEDNNNLRLSIKNINYNNDGSSNMKSENGFEILKDKLPQWIEEAKERNFKQFLFLNMKKTTFVVYL